ncbi:MAG: nucleotidyltransferase domain-containing protein [Muribaculaceae bacterium]|nr:nucleotidyltransferase domain-containing protein [Muribaculaceae bacterium]
MKLITDNIHHLRQICEKYMVRKLYVFGSILTARFNEESDVDFSVDFNAEEINRHKMDWSDIFFGLIESLEQLFGRKVDLIDERYISNKYFRKELDNTKILVYES